MIKVVISRKSDTVTGFDIKGHAGYDEEGKDIICSAVSAICYTALGYMNEKTPQNFTEEDGHISWKRIGLEGEDVDGVLNAMVIGLEQIRETYGRKYLTIKYEEEDPNVKN